MDFHFGDDWGIAGHLGLVAAQAAVGCTDLDVLATWSFRTERGLIRFGSQEGLSDDILRYTTEGWCRSLLGHGKTRHRDRKTGEVSWFVHQDAVADLGKRGALLTRAILPNWISDGKKLPVDLVRHLWFAPVAATALPLHGGKAAVIVAAMTTDHANALEVCRAIQPQTLDDCIPACAADACLSALLRVRHLRVSVTGWYFDWTPAVAQFRECRDILRADRVTAAALDFYASYASKVPPLTSEQGALFPDCVRGLVADNLWHGRKPYHDFGRISDRPLHQLRRGSRALLDTMS